MTEIAPPEAERKPEPWGMLRTNHALWNMLRRMRGEPEQLEPDWPAVWAAKVKAAARSADPVERAPSLPSRPPAGLNQKQAAGYCGMSVNHFKKLVDEGRMPKAVAGRWHVAALDAALSGAPALVPEIVDETWS